MEIRRLTELDADELWRLRIEALESEPQAFRETAVEHRQRTVASYAAQLRDGGHNSFVFGSFDDRDQLAGMIGLYTRQPGEGCIWGMYVTASHRAAGLGAKLLRATLDHARSIEGMRFVHLDVAHSQHAARKLYLSCGFEISDAKPATPCGGHAPEDQDHMGIDLLQDR